MPACSECELPIINGQKFARKPVKGFTAEGKMAVAHAEHFPSESPVRVMDDRYAKHLDWWVRAGHTLEI